MIHGKFNDGELIAEILGEKRTYKFSGNNPKAISKGLAILMEAVINKWNKWTVKSHFMDIKSMFKNVNASNTNSSTSSTRIAIKNCSKNECMIYSYGNYDGMVSWFYEDGHYRLTLTNRSGWGLYYPVDNELNTGRCGKTKARNLDDAISKFVKCYYIGHY
jgi:hypothetical protein